MSHAQRMSKLLTLVLPLVLAQTSHAQKVGIENEYAIVGATDGAWGANQNEKAHLLLEQVKAAFGGQGEIRVQPWLKYPKRNAQETVYVDPKGREWKIVPESVNTGGVDGLEFVSPPTEPEEAELLVNILKAIKSTKLVMRGLRSSNHLTVDVSHLTQNPADYNDLVNLILTIENNWAATYRVFDPIRYGTAVNRFSVPLAANQQGLLQELAALPPRQRTRDRVRAIFMKYNDIERQLMNPDGKNAARMWKYRAANYGKLFGLVGGEPIPVIEFRIGDLEQGSRLLAKLAFMRRLAKLTSDVLDKKFFAPFGSRPLTWEKANDALKMMKPSQSSTQFLTHLGLTTEGVSRLEDSARRAQAQSEITLINPDEAVTWSGKAASLGFEAEFRGESANNLATDDLKVRVDRYPYLSADAKEEATGNTEVRSVGGEWRISEVADQMGEVKDELGTSLKGFHVHVFVPAEAVTAVGEENFKAFVSLMADSLVAWRLQNRMTYFALKAWSQARLDPDAVEERATMRVKSAGEQWDIEIRGGMDDYELILDYVRTLLTALKTPNLVALNRFKQADMFVQPKTLEQALAEYAKIKLGRELMEDEVALAHFLENDAGLETGVLPLMRFDRLPFIDAATRRRIQDANDEFMKAAIAIMTNHITRQEGYDTERVELDKQFRYRMKLWAQDIDLNKVLRGGLLQAAGVAVESDVGADKNTREALKNSEEHIFKNAVEGAKSTSADSDQVLLAQVAAAQSPRLLSRYVLLGKRTVSGAALAKFWKMIHVGDKVTWARNIMTSHPELRSALLTAIGNDPEPDQGILFKQVLVSDTASFRNEDSTDLAKMMAKNESPEFLGHLANIMKSPTTSRITRKNVAAALFASNSIAAKQVLLSIGYQADVLDQAKALQAVGSMDYLDQLRVSGTLDDAKYLQAIIQQGDSERARQIFRAYFTEPTLAKPLIAAEALRYFTPSKTNGLLIPVLDMALSSSFKEVRLEAIGAIVALPVDQQASRLFAHLTDAAAKVAMKAAVTAVELMSSTRTDLAPVLVLIAKTSQLGSAVDQEKLIAALEFVNDPSAVEYLKAAVENSPKPVAREAAAVLARKTDASALQTVQELMRNGKSGVKQVMLPELAKRSDSAAIEILRQALHDPDAGTRKAAVAAVDSSEVPAVRTLQTEISALPKLAQLETRPLVPRLALLGDKDQLKTLRALAKNNNSNEADKETAISILGKRNDSKSFEIVEELSKSSSAKTRITAIEIMQLRRDSETMNLLQKALDDPKESVRERAKFSIDVRKRAILNTRGSLLPASRGRSSTSCRALLSAH